jgi:hypothetical protein|tara:strand:+ start:800 stop:1228 length:429 start_codon:yes stop_codon:yes gene_type:complete
MTKEIIEAWVERTPRGCVVRRTDLETGEVSIVDERPGPKGRGFRRLTEGAALEEAVRQVVAARKAGRRALAWRPGADDCNHEIMFLEEEEWISEDVDSYLDALEVVNPRQHITSFYKDLFGDPWFTGTPACPWPDEDQASEV